jgi:NAD(P)-dependent dehydrogenase (short-subunit alcohol dehydrogenase family)
MTATGSRVAIVAGASQGIGAGLVAGYRAQGWAVVANSLAIKPSDDPAVLTAEGDVSQPATGGRIVNRALERFGRIDTLVNNAGVFIGKPFTDYTIGVYQLVVGVNLTGCFLVTQRVVAAMLKNGGGRVVNISTTMVEHANSSAPALLATLTKGGLAALGRWRSSTRRAVPGQMPSRLALPRRR